MAEEEKQNMSGENVRRTASDENQHSEFLQNDPSSSNASQPSNNLGFNSQEDLRPVAYYEVQETDVLTIQQLPDEMCSERKSDENLQTRVFYEYPSDLEEESHLPQSYFDNRENLPSLQNAELLNIEKIRPMLCPKVVSQIQEAKPFGTDCKKNCSKTTLGKEGLEPTPCGIRLVDAAASVDIRKLTDGPKSIHQNTFPGDMIKCLGYSSDEFADVEDNVIESSPSDTNEISSGENNEPATEEPGNTKTGQGCIDPFLVRNDPWKVIMENPSNPKGGFIKSRFPEDTSEDEDLPSSSPEASCSNYVPKSKRPKSLLTAAKMPESKSVRKNTMDTIPEEPELEKDNAVNRRASEPPVSRTNPMVMKPVVGQRKDKCNVCNVRLGLCAIRCRCGGYYCAKHRYDREHNCTFDYRSLGAEEIRRNNPQVVAEKVRKL